MALNFDAEIRLDIGPFLQSINQARTEVKNLSADIDAINKKTLQIKNVAQAATPAAVGATVAPGAGLSERRSASDQVVKEIERQSGAQKDLNKHRDDSVRNIARERYALYDVAATYQMITRATVGALKGMSQAAISYEQAFANVIRTTEEFFTSAKIAASANAAKFALRELASEIPVTFKDLTQIATIGNQLGIAEGSIIAFTDTVSKFAAATGMTVETTAMSFGRIGELLNVPASEFNKMGSSIAFAGVRAVATEEQIVSVTREISTTAKMAKFTTPEIVGLSTAMSSLGIAPEMARGAIIRNFARINQAISEGGDKLDGYARIAGMSAEAFSYEWQKNGEVAFNSFLQGLQKISDEGGNLDTVLRDIGLVNVRDIQVIQKLGDNYEVYASSIRDANQGFEEGTFLADAYGITQDTVAARLQVIQNVWENLTASIGDAVISDEFKGILDIITRVLKRFDEIARSPVGKTLSGIIGVTLALVTALAAVNGITALARASMLAYALAMNVARVNADGVVIGLKAGAVATKIFDTALRGLTAVVIISAITVAVQKLSEALTPLEEKAENILGGFTGLQDALTDDLFEFNTALGDLDGNVDAAEKATGVIAGMSSEIENNNSEINKTIQAQNALNDVLGLTSQNADLLSTDFETLNFVIGANTIAWLKNAIAQSEAFQEMAKNTEVMKTIADAGFNIEDALKAAASGNMDDYIDKITQSAVSGMSVYEKLIHTLNDFGDAAREQLTEDGYLDVIIDVLVPFADFFGKSVALILQGLDLLFIGLNKDRLPVTNAIKSLGEVTEGSANQMRIFNARIKELKKEIDGLGDGAEKAEKEIDQLGKTLRTVVDYANDLKGVFSRVFEIRFGQQDSLDRIASGWNRIAEEADNARSAIARANAEIQELTADRSILEYQLTVAERYGDEARAASIRAKIAKIDQNMADKKKDVSDATDVLNKSTEGNSKTAIENRKVLMDQAKSYAELIEMYAKTGLRGKALRDKVRELKKEFRENAKEQGFNIKEIRPYTKLFDDIRESIVKTPRKVDIEFNSNVSAATQAVKEYLAKLRDANTRIETKIITSWEAEPAAVQRAINAVSYLQEDRRRMLRSGQSTSGIDQQIAQARANLVLLRGFAQGGYVSGPGTKTSDSIPAMLSNGEYVIRASSVSKVGQEFLDLINQGKISTLAGGGKAKKVKKYADGGPVASSGLDFLNALNQQKVNAFSPSMASGVTSTGSSIVHLSPDDRALLRAAIDRPVNLYTENAKIAQSANAGNVVLAQRGSN